MSTPVCSICKHPFDNGFFENCGGDCLVCMANVGGDPDCIAALVKLVEKSIRPLIKALKESHPHVEASGFDPNGDVLSVLDMALDLAGAK